MNTPQPSTALVPVSTNSATAAALRQAVAAHLARYTGQTRTHTKSDLRAYLTWCTDRGLEPLTAHRVHVELYVRWMQEVRTLGLSHLQFEAMLQAARTSPNINDFALVTMLGLLGLRIFEGCGADVQDLREEHGHRFLKVRGKGGRVVLTPLPPAVQRAIKRAVDHREEGPILRNRHSGRMDRHSATRRLHHLTETAGISLPLAAYMASGT